MRIDSVGFQVGRTRVLLGRVHNKPGWCYVEVGSGSYERYVLPDSVALAVAREVVALAAGRDSVAEAAKVDDDEAREALAGNIAAEIARVTR